LDQNIILGIAAAALLLALVNFVRVLLAGRAARRSAGENAAAIAAIRTEWEAYARKAQEERRRLAETAERLEQETRSKWEEFSARHDSARSAIEARVGAFEAEVGRRVEELDRLAERTRNQIDDLEAYIKQFFEAELKSVFRSFDKTVGSVLGEMKSELLRGIERIDQIQAVVKSKGMAQDRVLEGESAAFGLLSGAGEQEGRGADEPELDAEGNPVAPGPDRDALQAEEGRAPAGEEESLPNYDEGLADLQSARPAQEDPPTEGMPAEDAAAESEEPAKDRRKPAWPPDDEACSEGPVISAMQPDEAEGSIYDAETRIQDPPKSDRREERPAEAEE